MPCWDPIPTKEPPPSEGREGAKQEGEQQGSDPFLRHLRRERNEGKIPSFGSLRLVPSEGTFGIGGLLRSLPSPLRFARKAATLSKQQGSDPSEGTPSVRYARRSSPWCPSLRSPPKEPSCFASRSEPKGEGRERSRTLAALRRNLRDRRAASLSLLGPWKRSRKDFRILFKSKSKNKSKSRNKNKKAKFVVLFSNCTKKAKGFYF